MPVNLGAKDIDDMVAGTLDNLDPPSFSQIAQELQEYPVISQWLKKDRIILDHGIGIKRSLMTKTAGSARHAGLYEDDDFNLADLMTDLVVPWRHADTHWVYERREILMNRGDALIFNIIEPREAGAMIDMAQELEDAAWSAPSATDTKLPYGLPYWIVKNATTGFNGGLPSGHSTIAGVNITTHPNFKNYTAQYTKMTKLDLVKKMRGAFRKIKFVSPVGVKQFRSEMGEKFRIYTNGDGIEGVEELGEMQNENLGKNIASMDGQIVFRNVAIQWVPKLDDDTTDPFYMINHKTFFPYILAGDNLVRTGPERAPHQRNARVVAIDLTYNYLCLDRRRNAVIAKA